MRTTLRSRAVLAAPAAGLALLGSHLSSDAATINANFDQPTLDRWMYPFAGSPGEEDNVRIFGAFDNPFFDNRDSQMYLRYDTASQIPSGLPVSRYQIVSARVTVQNTEDLMFQYDNSVDPYGAFLAPSDPDFVEDVDAGQPLELFGAGYRNGFTAASFAEDGPYTPGDPLVQGVRNVYAAAYNASGQLIDVSLSVDQHFTPQPWAIGTISGLSPGQFVPIDSQIAFNVNVADPRIQAYFAQALASGKLPLTISGLNIVEFMEGSFPRIYSKENALVEFGIVSAARLQLTVNVIDAITGDFNGDGHVNGLDLAILLAAWTGPLSYSPCPPHKQEDLNHDCKVNGLDLAMLLAAWTG